MTSVARKRILIVDDDEGVRDALEGFLRDWYDVVTAVDGFDGWLRATEAPPDLIIANVRMPGIDGAEMVDRLRRTESLRRVPVIFMTSAPETPASGRDSSPAVRTFLPKPLDPSLVERRVRRALRAPC